MAAWHFRDRDPTDPDIFSRASSFPTAVGAHIRPGELGGYYFDLRFKAESPVWPPPTHREREDQFHVETAQWGLGAYDRFLGGEGDEWLQAARECGDYLLSIQESGGPRDGAWLHLTPMAHTYELEVPWVSAMAQGECASLLIRLHLRADDERYADAARRGLRLMQVPSAEGGASAPLDGRPFPEEYPTEPPSFVLNGAIFALWGYLDVALGLDDGDARRQFEDGLDRLARNLERWDTGWWSRYDLFPHPVANVASSAYHALHIAQLQGMEAIAPRAEVGRILERFERYASSAVNPKRAFAAKVAFRMLVPRSPALAHRLPWSHARRRAR
jgi:hypothetical protein